jgi:hypothetical protein
MDRKGKWFFGSILVYMLVGFADLYFKIVPVECIQVAWLLWMISPLVIPPVSTLWGMKPIWRQ